MFGLSAVRQLYVLVYCAIVCIGGFVDGHSFSNSFLDNLRGAPTTANSRSIVSVLGIFSAFLCGLTIVSCLALSYAVLSNRLGKVWNSLFFPMARVSPGP
jgi:hypothetical protein